MSQRALVIGGSVGGLFAAHLMRSIGWNVIVFERIAEDLTGRGAGISTHPPLIDVMRRIGIPFDETTCVKVDTLIFLDRGGNIIVEQPTARTMSAWARVYQPLKQALPSGFYRPGMALIHVAQSANGVTATFADGSQVSGDLLIGADGVRSTVREQLLPDAQPSYAGYVAWRAMLDENDIPPDIRAAIFERYTFCIPDGELFLAYAVPGRDNDTRVGRRAYNIVWYRPADAETLADLCTDATGRRHGMAIPPPLIRPDVIAAIKATARALIAPQVAEIFARVAQPFFQPIFDLESPRMVFGRVALLGDAAFVARPHVGAGVTKAALDAASLAGSIARDGIEAGLLHYEREQKPFGRGLVALGRREGAYLSAQLKAREKRSNEELRRDIDGLILAHNSRSENLRKLLVGRDALG